MAMSRQSNLKREREQLLQRLAEINEELRSSPEGGGEATQVRAEGVRRAPPLRNICLDMLADCGFMIYSQTIAQVCRAQLGREIPSTRFGTLSSDERQAYENRRPRPVHLGHGLTHERGEGMKRLWARSDWALEDRIVGPTTGRVLFLRFTEWINLRAEEADAGRSPAARPELLMYLAADCARDLGFRVRKGDRDFVKWREAAREELLGKEEADRAQRREAAARLAANLDPLEQLFGAREPLTSLPGTVDDWRSSGS